jgi:nucleoside-diphosphate-sugar epimerase
MAQWLITGGSGFIGSHIAEQLVAKKEKVRVLDDLSTGNIEYLKGISKQVEFVRGDIRDEKVLVRAMKGVDFVLHQAALRSVPRSVDVPLECNSINVDGTLKCLIAAHRAKVKRFVLASSSSIYGDAERFPQRENYLPSPISPYAVSKVTGEYYCRVFTETYGMSTVCLRYFNVYGPRQDPKSKYAAVVPRFIIQALKGEPLEIHWDGKQSRDFTYVMDVAQANILAATAPKIKQQVYNVGCGGSTSLLEITEILEDLLGRKLKKNFHPRRSGDVRKTMGDITAIKRDLKFRPQFKFEAGLKETFAYFSQKDRWKIDLG